MAQFRTIKFSNLSKIWVILGLLGLSGCFLNLSSVSADPVAEDIYEENDMFLTAKILSPNFYPGFCLNDSDWFKVDVFAYQILEVSIFFNSSYSNMEISFYDNVGGFISTTGDIGWNQELLRYTMGLEHKYVYFQIWEFNGLYSAENYDLDIKIYQDDGLEENDAFTSPRNILIGDSHPGAFVYTFDSDWYRVWVEAGHFLEFSLAFVQSNSGDIDVEIYDLNNIQLGGSYSTTNDEFVSVEIGVSDYYFIRVYQLWESYSGSYSWNVSQVLADDYLEENDDFNNPMNVNLGIYEGLSVYEFDPDWYQIWVEAGSQLNVRINFDHAASGDIDVEIYDKFETFLDGSYSEDNNEIVSIPIQISDFLYIRVLQLSSGFSGYYELDLFITESQQDRFEPNNDFYQSVYLSTNTNHSDLWIDTNNEDWYKIDVYNKQNVEIIVNYFPDPNSDMGSDPGEIYIVLYDWDNIELNRASAETGSLQIRHWIEVGGEYYIQVYLPRSNAHGNYNLQITIEGDKTDGGGGGDDVPNPLEFIPGFPPLTFGLGALASIGILMIFLKKKQ